MDKLKERLQPLQLSDEQKDKIYAQARNPKKQFAIIPFIIPVFIAIALLFIILQTMPPTMSSVTSAQSILKTELPLRYYILTTVTSIQVIVAYVLFKRNLKTTTRWQKNAFLQELHAAMTKPTIVITVIVVLIGAMWLGLLSIGNRWYVEILFVSWMYIILLLILLYGVRKMERTTCPHCGVKLTRRQILVKSAMQYRERCNTCKRLIYLTKASKQQMIAIFFWPVMPIWIGNIASSLHTGLVMIFCLVNILTIVYIYVPVMVEFTKENTDPEKLT
jgi:CXXC-20-CXXC protein